VADQWITVAYFDARVGIDVRQSLTSELSVELTSFIEAGTAKVQGILRAAGYTTPTTTTDELCKMAVFAIVYEMIAESPANSIALPENWESSQYRSTLQQLMDGDIQPTLSLASTGAAIGGWTTSSESTSACDSGCACSACLNTNIDCRSPRVTRRQLAGY
jgi:hypothetical protein